MFAFIGSYEYVYCLKYVVSSIIGGNEMSQEAKIFTGIGVLTVIVIIFAAFTLGNKSASNDQEKVLNAADKKVLIRKDSHVAGKKQAKLAVVEFGDFECPACGSVYGTVKKLQDEYKDKVEFVFREFPLDMHKNGRIAALAAEAAGGQGKFWEMHDKLYENQDKWSDMDDPLETFTTYAKEIGIDADKFKADVESKKYDSRITADVDDGNRLGVDSTPTFFINGKMYGEVLSYDDFKAKIESELKNQK